VALAEGCSSVQDFTLPRGAVIGGIVLDDGAVEKRQFDLPVDADEPLLSAVASRITAAKGRLVAHGGGALRQQPSQEDRRRGGFQKKRVGEDVVRAGLSSGCEGTRPRAVIVPYAAVTVKMKDFAPRRVCRGRIRPGTYTCFPICDRLGLAVQHSLGRPEEWADPAHASPWGGGECRTATVA
jgi:hypothetical protein